MTAGKAARRAKHGVRFNTETLPELSGDVSDHIWPLCTELLVSARSKITQNQSPLSGRLLVIKEERKHLRKLKIQKNVDVERKWRGGCVSSLLDGEDTWPLWEEVKNTWMILTGQRKRQKAEEKQDSKQIRDINRMMDMCMTAEKKSDRLVLSKQHTLVLTSFKEILQRLKVTEPAAPLYKKTPCQTWKGESEVRPQWTNRCRWITYVTRAAAAWSRDTHQISL